MSIKNLVQKLFPKNRQIIIAPGQELIVQSARDLGLWPKLIEPQLKNRASPT